MAISQMYFFLGCVPSAHHTSAEGMHNAPSPAGLTLEGWGERKAGGASLTGEAGAVTPHKKFGLGWMRERQETR